MHKMAVLYLSYSPKLLKVLIGSQEKIVEAARDAGFES